MTNSDHRPAQLSGRLHRNFGRAFGLLLSVLLFLVGFSLFNFRRLSDANGWNVHSYRVLIETHGLLESLINMETGARGFLLTGRPEFLEPYTAGARDFAFHWQTARDLTRDRPDQTARLDQLLKEQRVWRDQAITPLLAQPRQLAGSNAAGAMVVGNAEARKLQMDQMRSVIGAIQGTEIQLQAERQEEQRRLKLWTESTLWAGGLFSILLTIALISLAARNSLEIADANRRLSGANVQLAEANQRLGQANAKLEETNERLKNEVIERRRAEDLLRETVSDLERSNADLEQFAYVASHDLQEPLRAVGGCVQVLQRRYQGQLDERADSLVLHAVEGAQRMQNLINDLLAYSRLGTRTREFESVALEGVVDTVLSSLRVSIAESGAEVTRDPLPQVHGEPAQLGQVFQNLIANAVKFHGEAPARVHIGCLPGSGALAGFWVFSVTDNGTGIDPQYFERIFVMFQRLHTRNEYSGTGIGLAVCKKVVERHGGRIWVEARLGAGSKFLFTLRIEPVSAGSVRAGGESSEEGLGRVAQRSS